MKGAVTGNRRHQRMTFEKFIPVSLSLSKRTRKKVDIALSTKMLMKMLRE